MCFFPLAQFQTFSDHFHVTFLQYSIQKIDFDFFSVRSTDLYSETRFPVRTGWSSRTTALQAAASRPSTSKRSTWTPRFRPPVPSKEDYPVSDRPSNRLSRWDGWPWIPTGLRPRPLVIQRKKNMFGGHIEVHTKVQIKVLKLKLKLSNWNWSSNSN